MKRRRLAPLAILLAAALAAGFAIPGQPARAARAATGDCRAAFEVSLHSGPDAPLMIAGFLSISVDEAGGISGTLSRNDGPLVVEGSVDGLGDSIPVVGQANGRAINLAADLGQGRYLYGVGTSFAPLGDCAGGAKGSMGGPVVGPRPGDAGDWYGSGYFCIFPRFCCDVQLARCGDLLPPGIG